MKKIIFSAFIFAIAATSFAQNNVGIGTNAPAASAALDISSTTKGLLIPRMNSAQRTNITTPVKGLLVFDYETSTFWFHNGTVWTEMTGGSGSSSEWTTNGNDIYNNNSGNTGIGTNAPGFKLDVNGRVRLRHANNQTAGLWLDGPVNTNIGFMGTYNNNTIGIYGTGGAGWGLVFNTESGYTGIGTVSPTADLDVNGTMRLRGNAPAVGATLVSKDVGGNTNWQRAYAFKAEGLADLADVNYSSNATDKVRFNTVTTYNVGLVYNPTLSEFTAPVKGIYNFNMTLESYKQTTGTSGSISVRIMRKRNNITSIMNEYRYGTFISDVSSFQPGLSNIISGDFLLEAQDVVWIQAYSSFATHTIYGSAETASFSGRLVTQLY